ncbi:uncharacterized protein TRUGW13939_09126 [Talaromyces rugulosus]|uniref:Flavin reductase like domain-containing protein n=1 Tax=Talaromyces rugulosus TaxID=121627 RepID=A0A7H8R6I0_TALRU|nr:uncharacterized protein TRUGW13939_09126 [Talaromyces rugulosus]QKX61970.1 hypothetical protein TRUGW13939_09126 [Talaromyces rugulosus]
MPLLTRFSAASRAVLNYVPRTTTTAAIFGSRGKTTTTTSHHFAAGPDFEQTKASRPDFNPSEPIKYIKPPNGAWQKGDGASDGGASLSAKHVAIDPYAPGRSIASNYKLLVSGIVPRPIAFISTRSKDGTSVNLAPFSYFQVINHDPPLFTVSFVGSIATAKDTLKNLLETKECVINVISEHFMDAANATAVNAPYGVSEFGLAGLHQAESSTVAAPRVRESVFSIEGKLFETKEFESRAKPGKKTSVLAIIEGTRFWVREDAINEGQDLIDLEVLRPVSRLGGIRYGRTTEVVELERPAF